MPPASFARVRLLVTLGVVWLLGVTVVHPSATRIDVWPWAGLVSAGWVVFVIVALARLAQGSLPRLGGLRDAGLAAYAGVIVISAWTSPWFGGSLASSLPVLGGTALLYLLADAFAREESATSVSAGIDAAAVALGVVSAGSWLLRLADSDSLPAALAGRNDVPFGHSVHTAGACLLAASWLGSRAVAESGRARSWRLAAAAAAVGIIFTTASRAGVAALGAIGFLLVAAWWFRRGCRVRDALVGGGLLLAVSALGIGTNARLRAFVLQGGWNVVSVESNQQRLAMAHAGLSQGAAHGLFGPGPGTVPLAYGAGAARMPHAPDGALQLHSAPLQIWATTGPAGTLALGLLLAGLLPAVWRGFARKAPPAHTVLAAGLAGYGLFALTDHQFDVPYMLVFVLVFAAVLTAPHIRTSAKAHARRLVLVAMGAVLLAGPLTYRARDLAARAAFAAAAEAHDAGRMDDVHSALTQAASRAPWDRFYREAAAAWSWDDDPSAAAGHLRTVLALPIPWPPEFATYNLAWIELARGGTDAPALFLQAARLAPQRAGVHFGLGLALAAQGDHAGANRAFARQCLADPRFVTLPHWDDSGMQARWPEVRAAFLELAHGLEPLLSDDTQRRQLRYVAALVRWWREPSSASLDDVLSFAPPAASAHLRALAQAPVAGRGPWTGAEAWGLLGETWAHAHPPAGVDPAWADPLTQRVADSPDFAAFVTRSVGDTPAWRRAYRVNRGGYRIVMHHPASPALYDYPVFEENLLLAPHASALFPSRGWLPGAAWRQLADDDAAGRE